MLADSYNLSQREQYLAISKGNDMNVFEDNGTVKVRRSNEIRDGDSHLWCSRLEAALNKKEIGNALTKDKFSAESANEALSSKVNGLSDKALGAIQD